MEDTGYRMHDSRKGGASNKGGVSNSGFTLLELMVSFAIVALLTLIIGSALRVGIGAVERSQGMVDSLERIRASMNIINSQVQSQLPITYDEDGERRYYFEGKKDYMRLSTNYSIWNGQGGYVVVRYEVVTDGSNKRSMMVTENIIGIEKTMQTELFKGLDDVYFEYFYKGPTDEKGDWVSEWTEKAILPERIRLTISYGGFVSSMIIPMRITGEITDLTVRHPLGPLPEERDRPL
ncbi:MAG: prepilin-type N-terminal cleavage/methylation domain-containing protein [Thermodesulfovibrionia bacterium]